MPFIDSGRRMAGVGELGAFADELPTLFSAGVRAVVSLLNIPSDQPVYRSAGFGFLCLPIADGEPPTAEQADTFVGFVDVNREMQNPVAVHCEAGLGRTGTMLAVYMISRGEKARNAIERVRAVERAAIETMRQIKFLEQFEQQRRHHE